jgi:hypothetical protein
MADYVPSIDLGVGAFTSTTSSAVTGGQRVKVSGSGTVAPAVATDAAVCGVAAFDAASGAKVTVFPLRMVHRTNVGTAGVTAGNILKSDANGAVIPMTVGTDSESARVGIALETGTTGNPIKWLGTR